MSRPGFPKIISSVMAMVFLAFCLNGFCLSSWATAESTAEAAGLNFSSLNVEKNHCPSCPVEEHSNPDHHDSSCHCPCHAQLTSQSVQVAYSSHIAPLEFSEPFKALPEVYLPKFIPPHILV